MAFIKMQTAPSRGENQICENSGEVVWVRAPKRGVEPHYGLSRSMLYLLEERGEIESVSLRFAWKSRGVKLFNLPSILNYLGNRAGQNREVAA